MQTLSFHCSFFMFYTWVNSHLVRDVVEMMPYDSNSKCDTFCQSRMFHPLIFRIKTALMYGVFLCTHCFLAIGLNFQLLFVLLLRGETEAGVNSEAGRQADWGLEKSVRGRCVVQLWIFWTSQKNWNRNHAALIKHIPALECMFSWHCFVGWGQ